MLAPFSTLKSSSAGGEWAPDFYLRSDLAKHQSAAKTLRNMVVSKRGSLYNRPGLQYMAKSKNNNQKIRVIPFEFSSTQQYMIEAGNLYFRWYVGGVNGGQVLVSSGDSVQSYPTAPPGADTFTKLLLHFEIDFTDSEATPKTVTAHGGAAISTTQYQFGASSCVFDGTGDYLTLADSNDWSFGSGDGTVDFWVRFSGAGLGTVQTIFSQADTASTTNYFRFYWDGTVNKWKLFQNSPAWAMEWADTLDGNWHHIALVKSGSTFYVFRDGVSLGTQTNAGANANYTGLFSIGTLYTNNADQGDSLNAYLDEFRWSKGTARWTANFTPYTVPYPLSWATGTVYSVGNFVFQGTSTYYCKVAHTSGTFITDLSSGFWVLQGATYSGAPAWVTSTIYTAGQYVTQSATVYFCLISHTSGTFATDLAAGKWVAQNTYEIASPYLESELAALRYAQSADIEFIASATHAPQMLERLGNTNWQLAAYPYTNGPFMIPNTDSTSTITPSGTTGSITLVAANAIFNLLQVGALWQIKHFIQGQVVSSAFTGTATGSSIGCGGTWRLITHGTWTGTIRVQKSTDNGTTWTDVRTFTSANDFNADTFGTEPNPSGNQFLVRLKATALGSGTCNADLTTDEFTQTGIAKITAYTDTQHVTATVLTTLGGTTATADWSEGSWSDYRGWPTQVTFNQDRLVWAATTAEPDTYWMTEAGNYYAFTESNPLLDSDSISEPLPSRQLNAINGLSSLLGLIGFTSSAEWAIGNPGDTLTPTTIQNRLNSSYGSYGLQPILIGNRVIYIQSSGIVVRDLAFQYFYNYFDGADISIFSYHLFQGYSIVEMAFQLDPDSIVWMVRSDGQLISMTYLREQELIAFALHNTNGGTDLFESVASMQGSGYKEVWFSVNRGGQRYIERFVNRNGSTVPADQIFSDCAITYSGAPATVITGLPYPDGTHVAVLADGLVINNYDSPATVTSGQITLAVAASKVQIGKPYRSDYETLNFEVPTNSGTIQGKQANIPKNILQVLNSWGGKIGMSFSTLYSISKMTGNVGNSLYSGECGDSIAGGFQAGARICIRQSDPLPLQILAVIPQVTSGGVSTLR